MSDWSWGINQGNAINQGRLARRLKEANASGKEGWQEALAYQESFHKLRDTYTQILANKNGNPRMASIEILANARPDLHRDADIHKKRRINLEMIAWCEYVRIAYGDSELVNKKETPKLLSLSQAMGNGSIQGAAAAKALEDIANRIAIATNLPIDDPVEWVQERVDDMLTTVKWTDRERTFPMPESLDGQKGKHPVIQDIESKHSLYFDPISNEWDGVADMALRL